MDGRRRFPCSPRASSIRRGSGSPRRLQSALRPSPGHLAPPAPRSRAVLSCRYLGVVARDHTIRLGERRVQLPSRVHGRSYAGLRVEVRELLDSRLVVLHDGRVLATQPSPGPYFVLTPRRSPSSDREGRRQRHVTAMRKALTDLARAENRPGWPPAEVRAEPAGDATTHDRQAGRYVDTPARARNSTRAQWRPAPSHPWRRAAWRRSRPRNAGSRYPQGDDIFTLQQGMTFSLTSDRSAAS